MKKSNTVCSMLLLTALSCPAGFAQQTAEAAVQLDSIAAVVDENVILVSELEAEFARVKKRVAEQNINLPDEKLLKKQVLDNLVLRQLQIAEAKKRGIKVDDITLNETIRNIAKQKKQTLEELRMGIIQEGYDYGQYREDLRNDILINQLEQSAVYNRISISKRELEDFIKAQKSLDNSIQYLISHIQFSLPETADAEAIEAAEQRAQQIYQRLVKGEDFAKVALIESEGPSALQGGDLGWMTVAEIPSLFIDTIQTMKVGEISKPIRAPRGFHIVKLRDTKGITRHIVREAHVRHIMLPTNTLNTDDKVRKQLADIRQQILDGASFSELAKTHSADPGSAAEGGDTGWNEPDVFVPQFAKVVETLPVNKLSEPFKTQYGWHIVEVLGWRDNDKTLDFEMNDAYRNLRARKARLEEELWLHKLRDEAYVELRID